MNAIIGSKFHAINGQEHNYTNTFRGKRNLKYLEINRKINLTSELRIGLYNVGFRSDRIF
jgi:hypothetical protein